MLPRGVLIFLFIAVLFAAVHDFAVATSLYWYYSWFDIVMHFWGGVLVVIGVRALCSLRLVPLAPTAPLVFATLLLAMVSWEVFEYTVGLYNPSTYWFDVSKDLLVGTTGGLVGYFGLRRLTI